MINSRFFLSTLRNVGVYIILQYTFAGEQYICNTVEPLLKDTPEIIKDTSVLFYHVPNLLSEYKFTEMRTPF